VQGVFNPLHHKKGGNDMEYSMYRIQAVTITELVEVYDDYRKEEFLECYQYQLEGRYGFDIEELADMVFGRRPDITERRCA